MLPTLAQYKATQSLKPQSLGVGTNNGAAIDTLGWDEALILLLTGTAGASATVNVKIQDSADGSTGWADLSGAAFTTVNTANDDAMYIGRVKTNGLTCKRYIRVVTVVGTAASLVAVAVLQGVPSTVESPVSLAFNV